MKMEQPVSSSTRNFKSISVKFDFNLICLER